VADNIEAILIGVVVLSIVPVIFEYLRHKRADSTPSA
jgi:hypothetical protein